MDENSPDKITLLAHNLETSIIHINVCRIFGNKRFVEFIRTSLQNIGVIMNFHGKVNIFFGELLIVVIL